MQSVKPSKGTSTHSHLLGVTPNIGGLDNRFHGDDMGRDTRVVKACRVLAEKGQLRSFSVMANGSDVAGAIKLHLDYPSLPVSLHFDIVNGTAKAGRSSLTRRDGVFKLPLKEPQGFIFQLIRMMFFGIYTLFIYKKLDIKNELQAQYDFLVEQGFGIAGIDAEQHLHAYSPAAEIVMDFAQNNNLKVRMLGDWQPQGTWPRLKLKLLGMSAFVSSITRTKKFKMPATWGSLSVPYVIASWEKIDIKKVPEDTFIECHPGTEFDVKLWEQIS